MRRGSRILVGLSLPALALCAVAGALLGLGGYTFWYAEGGSYFSNDPRSCVNCHIMRDHYDGWVKSSHHAVAACNDCHNLHEIKPLGDPASFENRKFHTEVCLKCHADESMMERNGVLNVAVKTYMESYHGKNYHLGFPLCLRDLPNCRWLAGRCARAADGVPNRPGFMVACRDSDRPDPLRVSVHGLQVLARSG